jgi:hypothetical protein
MRYNDLLTTINKPDKIEPGYKSARNWAKEWGKSDSQTRRVLKDAVSAKIATRKIFKIPMVDGVLRRTPHFKFKS